MARRYKQIQWVGVVFLLLGALSVAARHFFVTDAKAAEAQPANPLLGSQPGNAADEKGIRATADEFVKAFNAGDAKTIGAQWSTDAKYTDESGRQFIGRDAIEKEYASLFKEHPGATITVNIDSIRFLGPDIALETGVAKVQLPKGSAATASHYNVVHARRDGKWVIVVGHDTPYVSSLDEDYLKDLEWTIGQWNAGTKDKEVHINFEWMAGRNFIKNTYMLIKDGKSTLTGGQIIGWDPLLGSIVSWHFDALGGFGHDVWTREGSKWVIHAAGIMRDASDSSAVNIITPIDANSFTWQSTKRTLDGVSLPDVPPVKIVRRG